MQRTNHFVVLGVCVCVYVCASVRGCPLVFGPVALSCYHILAPWLLANLLYPGRKHLKQRCSNAVVCHMSLWVKSRSSAGNTKVVLACYLGNKLCEAEDVAREEKKERWGAHYGGSDRLPWKVFYEIARLRARRSITDMWSHKLCITGLLQASFLTVR